MPIAVFVALLSLSLYCSLLEQPPAAAPPHCYQFDVASPGGTGKFYLGREISRVMGHRGAGWLERPERQWEEKPEKLLDSLDLQPGMVVADIGAGSGYFTRRLAQRVGPEGQVYAVDIQPEMIEILTADLSRRGIDNVRPILGRETDPGLTKDSIDLTLLVDVYHEFSHPYEMLKSLGSALKPGGRLVFVEYRAEDPEVPIKRLHKMTEAQVRKEAAVHPLQWMDTLAELPRQHVIVFRSRQ